MCVCMHVPPVNPGLSATLKLASEIGGESVANQNRPIAGARFVNGGDPAEQERL